MFYTVDLLGKALFTGLRVILLYSAVHLVIALAIGLTVARLADYAETHAARARWMTAIIIGGFFVTIVAVGVLTAPFRELLPWWSIIVANALAALFAGLYLIRRRRGVFGRLLFPMRTA